LLDIAGDRESYEKWILDKRRLFVALNKRITRINSVVISGYWWKCTFPIVSFYAVNRKNTRLWQNKWYRIVIFFYCQVPEIFLFSKIRFLDFFLFFSLMFYDVTMLLSLIIDLIKSANESFKMWIRAEITNSSFL